MAAVHGAAWISAAVRAACQAKAPRRTVASVAAAVTATLLQETAKAAQAQGDVELAGTAGATPSGTCEDLAQQLREARALKRREKRQRRREKARTAATPSPPTAEVEERQSGAIGEGAPTLFPPTLAPEPDQTTSALTDEALQDHVARTSPQALAAEGMLFPPEELVVPAPTASLPSSAPTDTAFYLQTVTTPTHQATRAAPKTSPSQTMPRQRDGDQEEHSSPGMGPFDILRAIT